MLKKPGVGGEGGWFGRGLGVLVYSPAERVPVADGAGHVAADDEVELEIIGPLALHVVDFEPKVRGCP